MNAMLTSNDIREFLASIAAAIEQDQIRVDGLPPGKFHCLYDDDMWCQWRREHLDYINQLIPTVDSIPATTLEELTRVAMTYNSAIVGEVVRHLFSDAIVNCPKEEFETAAMFFDWLIMDVTDGSDGALKYLDARTQMMGWLPLTDPLRISRDPECGYELPADFVS